MGQYLLVLKHNCHKSQAHSNVEELYVPQLHFRVTSPIPLLFMFALCMDCNDGGKI